MTQFWKQKQGLKFRTSWDKWPCVSKATKQIVVRTSNSQGS